MELQKPQDNLSCKIGDVTFFFRSQMTVRDKVAIDMVGTLKDGRWVMDRDAYITKIIERFVTGWDGVTENGKPVPYSYDVFMERFPSGQGTFDLLLDLSDQIGRAIGLFTTPEKAEEKNA